MFSPIAGTTDNTPPVISGCPSGVVVTAAPGATSAAAFWNVPTASDDSGMVTLSSVTASPGDSFPIGSTEVSYTFRDPTGNPAVCSFTVVVSAGMFYPLLFYKTAQNLQKNLVSNVD